MVRAKDKYTVSVDFPAEWKDRIAALAQHETTSVNGVINRAVMEAMLAFEGDQTTRVRVRQIQADLAELNRKFALLESMGWAQLNALELTVKVSDDDKEWVERLMKARG